MSDGRNWAGFLETAFPEKRIFIRSATGTRFLRIRPGTQAVAWGVGLSVFAWTLVATSMVIMDGLGAGNFRDQARRDREIFTSRLNAIAEERDHQTQRALTAEGKFTDALEKIADMQRALLDGELAQNELRAVVDSTKDQLVAARDARDAAMSRMANLESTTTPNPQDSDTLPASAERTFAFLTDALENTASERDGLVDGTEEAVAAQAALRRELDEVHARNEQVFRQLEEAMTISVEPLEKMFRAAGLNTDQLLREVRRNYSGQGGPITPFTLATRGAEEDADMLRATALLDRMDQLNLYRIAAEKVPFSYPVKSAFRFTSGFGPRWGRMHYGTDFAASHGTPIYATADGVVVHAGWSSGYGRLIKIRHAFGIETRYAHLAKFRVEVGQRVSRGERIGDMGNSGRSTGTHLHYEVRVDGKAVNPMIYLKAAKDVF